ncbi:hypothetical protein DSECCO2_546140 [anaerobic digester metagenome]
MHEHALIGSPSKADHACSELGIEPSSCLVMPFGNKVSRPPFIKLIPGLRELEGCPGSYSRVKPDVKDIFNTLFLPAALTGHGNSVHIGAVKFYIAV